MTFQHVSDPAARVVSMAAHHARHAQSAEQRNAAADAERADFEAWHGTKAPRTFDAAVTRAPTFPRNRRRPAPLSLFLIGCAVGIALAFGITAALADHLIERTQVELAAAENHKSM